MRFKRMLTTVDTHTAGNPTRTVIGGIPYIPGHTVSEKMLYLKNNMDWIRKILVHEPRGNDVMSSVIITEPCTPGADFGVIFAEVGGYLPMCGHDTIGVCTTLVETGMVVPVEPYTYINLDTPAGVVKAKVLVENGVAKEVSFTNVPSFVFARIWKLSFRKSARSNWMWPTAAIITPLSGQRMSDWMSLPPTPANW